MVITCEFLFEELAKHLETYLIETKTSFLASITFYMYIKKAFKIKISRITKLEQQYYHKALRKFFFSY